VLLSPKLVRIARLPQPHELRFDLHPLQLGLQRSPWHVCIATMLQQSASCPAQLPTITQQLFELYPNPLMLCIADEDELQRLLLPLSYHRTRARHLQRVSWKWDADGWEDLRELPGVSERVADAVVEFCFKEPACNSQ